MILFIYLLAFDVGASRGTIAIAAQRGWPKEGTVVRKVADMTWS